MPLIHNDRAGRIVVIIGAIAAAIGIAAVIAIAVLVVVYLTTR